MTTQHSASHPLQGWSSYGLRFLFLVLMGALSASVHAQCTATSPYLPSDPCYIQVTTADPFCCTTSWDTLCQSAYDACNPGGGGSTDCLNTTSFGSAVAPTDGTVVTISSCNFQTEYATVTGLVAGQTYQAGSSCSGWITVRSGTFNGPVVAAGNAPLSFTATVSGTYFFHYNTNSACGTAFSCCVTTIACTSCPTGGGGGGDSACTVTLAMQDSFGDGWNGAFITVAYDGVNQATYSAAGFGSSATFSVPEGVQVTFTYSPGTWEGEVSYSISINGALVYGAGPSPPIGLVYSFTCSDDIGGGTGGSCAPGVGGAPYAGVGSVQIAPLGGASPDPSLPVVSTPQELITEVFLGECLAASNISYIGNPASIGTFSNGWGIGIESGIVLTTGSALDAVGPNTSGSTSYLSGSGASALLGANTYDQSTFTFTFVPETDQVTFTYVFASEEYPEFVCSSFNDAFGFFVSGPGYAGNTNIAIIPGSVLPVAINTVNPGFPGGVYTGTGCSSLSYSSLYVNNVGGTHNEYDGFTLPLTACINTVPCESYTITITVADASDQSWDSAVFLAAESFSAGTELDIVASVDQDLANVSSGVNCDMGGFFVFALEEPATDPVTLVYTVDVQGEALVDPIPLTVTFQPGETLVAVPVTSVAAGTSLTTVELTMSSADNPGLGCSCTETELTSTLFLCDQLLLLPVTWLAFEAKNINEQREVLCEWITASEQNNDFFTVERSVDGQVWIEIGTVAGSGNTSEPTNYQFIDRSPVPGVSYYRIRQTDYDGQFDYSETRAVERKAAVPLEAFPNPGNGIFKLSGYHDGDLSVYDLSGRRVPFTLSMHGELRLVNIAAGTYIVELVRESGEAERIRIVVQ